MMTAKEVIKNRYADRHKFSGRCWFRARLNRDKPEKFAPPWMSKSKSKSDIFFVQS